MKRKLLFYIIVFFGELHKERTPHFQEIFKKKVNRLFRVFLKFVLKPQNPSPKTKNFSFF